MIASEIPTQILNISQINALKVIPAEVSAFHTASTCFYVRLRAYLPTRQIQKNGASSKGDL